jgi:hypothetical protein
MTVKDMPNSYLVLPTITLQSFHMTTVVSDQLNVVNGLKPTNQIAGVGFLCIFKGTRNATHHLH